MPLLTIFIAPLLSLYLRYGVVQFGIKIALFTAIFGLFKSAMQFIITQVFGQVEALQLPCMASYIINSLDVLPMMNFALSLWGTIYIGKYLLNSMMKLV